MGLYNEILRFDKYFNSLRMHEGLIVIDLKLPLNWKDKEVLNSRGNKIQMKSGSNNEKHKLVSLFSQFDVSGTEMLIEEILAIIKWNRDQEEKNELLNIKMVELKKMFNENNVDSLRKLNIGFNNKLELNGEELTGMVKERDTQGRQKS